VATRQSLLGRRQVRGFTLLEIMVAMLLLAVIVTASVSLLFINIRGWDALVSDSERVLDETLIDNRITASLRHLSPLLWRTEGSRRLAFSGEVNQLHFISRAPLQYRRGGLFEYLLSQEIDNENRLGLVLYYAPYHPDRSEFVLPGAGERRLLFADTGGVTFSYFGLKDPTGKRDWWESWEDNLNGYPEMVKIEFHGTAGEEDASTRFVRLLVDGSGPLR
jgi:general secretion pathway protein J